MTDIFDKKVVMLFQEDLPEIPNLIIGISGMEYET